MKDLINETLHMKKRKRIKKNMTHDLWIIRHVFYHYAITAALDITYTGLESDVFNTFW